MDEFGRLWHDRRSGLVGRIIGEFALKRLQAHGEHWLNVGGTVFSSDHRIIIGRTAKEEYCRVVAACSHWANVSRRQLARLVKDAGSIPVLYLFVSLIETEDAIRTWLVPAGVIEEQVFSAANRKKTDESDLKIIRAADRWMIGEGDISSNYQEFSLPKKEREAVARSLANERNQKATFRKHQADNGTPHLTSDGAHSNDVGDGEFRFELKFAGSDFVITGNIKRRRAS